MTIPHSQPARADLRAQNDHNVYILGAGFAVDAGLPTIRSFFDRLRDSRAWLAEQDRRREFEAVGDVLEFRHLASAAGYRVALNLDNIEELFSLAAIHPERDSYQRLAIAIASTIDFCRKTSSPRSCQIMVDNGVSLSCLKQVSWEDVTPSGILLPPGQDEPPHRTFSCPAYDFYVGVLCSLFTATEGHSKNSIITFNYDTVVEDTLARFGVPVFYGLPNDRVEWDSSVRGRMAWDAEGVPLFKLHGSVNWAAIPGAPDQLRVFSDYDALRGNELTPVLMPPTWRKSPAGSLQECWNRAVAAISTATRIVIVGFSLPEADTHFRYLIAAGLQNNVFLRDVVFVNPDADVLRRRIGRVFRSEMYGQGRLRVREETLAWLLFNRNGRESIGRSPMAGILPTPDAPPEWANVRSP